MNTREFRNKYGKDECERICKKARTTYEYYKQLCQKERRPSVDLAERLVEASGNRLDFRAVLTEKDSLTPSN